MLHLVKDVVLHNSYEPTSNGKGSKTNDIALLLLDKPIQFNNDLSNQNSIMPICWSNDDQSSTNLNEDDLVHVAGWGNTYDQYCNTKKNGPSPYQRCQKQFRYNRETYYGCAKRSSPSSADRYCKYAYKILEKNYGKGAYEDYLNKKYYAIRIRFLRRGVKVMEKDCFSFEKGTDGWCATCNPETREPGKAGYCRINEDGNMLSRNCFYQCSSKYKIVFNFFYKMILHDLFYGIRSL